MTFDNNLDKILFRYEELAKQLSLGNLSRTDHVTYSKEYSDLGDLVEKVTAYKNLLQEVIELKQLIADSKDDKELQEEAVKELRDVEEKIPEYQRKIKVALLPKDSDDEKNVIIEVRAGTGGEEAALFAANLFRMYQRYTENNRWKFEILSISDTGVGGYKEASALVTGKGVYARLKYESGAHRVQRVPETESSGRIHTSAATVAVLVEAEEVDIHINESDLRIDTYRASGAGGQHVNTTDSAVRVTHIPSGIVVQCQDEKSQHKNKAKCLKILRSRIYDHEKHKIDSARAEDRKIQVGSGDRSERIRTYNLPQGRVTDHRINLTLYKIEAILKEGELNEFIEALIAEDEAKRLAAKFE